MSVKDIDCNVIYDLEGNIESEGWIYAWNGGNTNEIELMDAIADKLAPLGITVEMSGDDDWGAIRFLKGKKVL